MAKGYVYILVNPSFQEEWIKIGQTENLGQRVKTLSNQTCVPFPFQVYAYCMTEKYKELERYIHHVLTEVAQIRVTPNREFSNLYPLKPHSF